MKPEIKQRLTDDILAEARQRYGIADDGLTDLPAFESFMYGFSNGNGDYILRLSHSLRRTPEMIWGEVDWINYLSNGGAGVANAELSTAGNLVEAIDDGQGTQFLATAFVKAAGGPMWTMGGMTDDLIDRYGRLLGRIHKLSQRYTPTKPEWQRPLWDSDVNMDHQDLINQDKAIGQKHLAVMAHLQALPRTADGFGMIHQDAHAGNFFVDEAGHITLFDFDDCVYGHFAYDLAMVLFYAVTNHPEAETFGPTFWDKLWAAYQQENALDPRWLAEIPHFMKLREIDLYTIINRDIDLEEQAADGWLATYMNGRRERILNDIPYLQMDFT